MRFLGFDYAGLLNGVFLFQKRDFVAVTVEVGETRCGSRSPQDFSHGAVRIRIQYEDRFGSPADSPVETETVGFVFRKGALVGEHRVVVPFGESQ
jgi:hypothetical protein